MAEQQICANISLTHLTRTDSIIDLLIIYAINTGAYVILRGLAVVGVTDVHSGMLIGYSPTTPATSKVDLKLF